MGIQCVPRCGNCQCKKCALGTNGLSIREEREQKLINKGLEYNEEEHQFLASYPWTKDPYELPNNYKLIECLLKSK